LITVAVPPDYTARPTQFVSELENLTMDADRPARVVISERTGTDALGKDVRVSRVEKLYVNLSVEIQTRLELSQPGTLAQIRWLAKGDIGTTEVVPQTVTAREEKAATSAQTRGDGRRIGACAGLDWFDAA
jgi:flagellar P-ring protein precursor FlgI